MKRKIIIILGIIITIILFILIFNLFNKKEENEKFLEATILENKEETILVQDENNIIYNLNVKNNNYSEVGDNVLIKYTGVLDKNNEKQSISVVEYKTIQANAEYTSSMFKDYYKQAENILKNMTLDEKIGQMFLVRVPEEMKIEVIKEYKIGGYLLFERDFEDKTKKEVINMIKSFQNEANIPLLIATDEEGGNVVRVSSNKNLRETKFASPRELYLNGGMDKIIENTKEKSKLLSSLGINLNLAPVVDVSTDPNDYMYNRTIGENTNITSEYAENVIKASKTNDVSYTLKHFPGYGNNDDTHTNKVIDNRSYNSIIENDIPPFSSGIKAGAEAVLISHNVVSSIDKDNPASLSVNIHNLLRNTLDFSGVIITDDLEMSALLGVDDKVTKAVLSGNDLIIITDLENITKVKNAVKAGKISEEQINNIALKIIAWKYYKGLMFDK